MGLFDDIVKLGVDTVFLPGAILEDFVETATGENDDPLENTKKNLEEIKEDLEEVAEDL